MIARLASREYRVSGSNNCSTNDNETLRARTKQQECPGCTFSVADGQALPFADASFAVVAAITSLEFMPDPAATLREMARCTRPGGIIL
ncbi:MAG: class I SAM-dependent methyltransferase, partial [Thermoleophilia bacterium]|nr:class I SAM-dependent methyltransferase [Thermoleophilia bacterium]